MRKKIENALIELGITPAIAGFEQICSAVEIISNSKKRKKLVLEIYPDVAKELGTTVSSVERGIRHAITKIDTESEAFNKYLGMKKLTNFSLLYTLAHRLCKEETDEIRKGKIHNVSDTHEISVDWNGYNFLIIYGKHINGWFIAIPNWEVCVEASNPADTFYNSEKLAKALDRANAGIELANAIKEHWEGLEK